MKELLKWVSITNRNCARYMDRSLERFGINSSQYFYILKVCEDPGITQDRLFQDILVNPSNITRALAQLEKLGYLTRTQSCADKRTWNLHPTEKSRECYEEIRAIANECGEQVLQPFTLEERAHFLSMLQKSAYRAISINRKEKREENHENNTTRI